jgi:general stress protein YciG
MEILEFFREQGRQGGKIGGRRRKEATTKAQRQEWGRKGGLASGKIRSKKARAKKRGA